MYALACVGVPAVGGVCEHDELLCMLKRRRGLLESGVQDKTQDQLQDVSRSCGIVNRCSRSDM